MKIDEVMTRDAQTLAAEETIQAAAQMMAELDARALPVGTADRLEGILTDRDIIIRVVAEGLDVTTTLVRQAMSSDVVTCAADASVEEIRQDMLDRQIRRMPVLDGEGRLIGLVSLESIGDAARQGDSGRAAGRAGSH